MPPEEESESEQTLSLWREINIPCESGSLEEVARLLEVNPGLARQRNGDTPLHTACWRGSAAIVELLIKKGAVIDAPDRWGCTALYWAAFSGHQAVVDLLVSSGADPTIRNQQGWNALMSSSSRGHSRVLQSLLLALRQHRPLDVVAVINEADKDGQTALFRAAYAGHAVVVSMLLACGADERVSDRHGRRAVEAARSNGHAHCATLLQDAERAWSMRKARAVLQSSRLEGIVQEEGEGGGDMMMMMHRWCAWGKRRWARGGEAPRLLALGRSEGGGVEAEVVWWAVEEANDDMFHELMGLLL